VEELLQQVADLQQKLAAATTAHAAASAAVAVAGSNRLQQQAGDTQQEQQAQADAMQEQVQQLQAALEDQTLELQEWQIHADVSAANAQLICSCALPPPCVCAPCAGVSTASIGWFVIGRSCQ
jgi:multidrug resistance efflux pump